MLRDKIKCRYLPVLLVLFLMFVISCTGSGMNAPEGLAESGGGSGPAIWFDPLAKPVPEIPFPNDLATVLDGKAVTGRRINISTEAPTNVERDVRRQLNTLDGFGTYSALTVRFDKPLDLATITEGNIMVIKLLDPKAGDSPPLDLGKGYFPSIWKPDNPWWAHDPYGNANNIIMDPGNMADLDGNTVPEFVDFYEFETNTLIIRNLRPLEEASRYAVVLLKGLKGLDGQPVRSSFRYINHTMQTEDLRPVVDLLSARGISLDQVAFTWSFTTQSISPDWVNIWNGLNYGTGPLGYLGGAFPPVLKPTDLQLPSDGDGNPYTLKAAWFEPILKMVATLLGESSYVTIADFRYIDNFIFGTFESPSFFTGLDFGNPLYTDARFWDPIKLSGKVPADRLNVTWMLAVPKDEDLGLDYCQNPPAHPFGCKDYEENDEVGTQAKGPDSGYGFAGVDDNNDGWVDDEGEYMWLGSDDVSDPACDNYYANVTDFPAHCACASGGVVVPNPATGECTQTQGNHQLDSFGSITEDANGDGRLNTPPFPVAYYGHGHTSSRVESIGFAGPMAMFGISLFGMDNFGHGPMTEFGNLGPMLKDILVKPPFNMNMSEVCHAGSLSGNCSTVFGLLAMIGADLNGDKNIDENDVDGKTISQIIDGVFSLGFFRVLGTEGRAYDTDGDTIPNSGDIFWTANILQTRDLVRQTAVDWMQFVRATDMLGVGATFDLNGDTVPDLNGDFNLDGQYDIGGPTAINTRGHFYFGSSLGGMMGDVNMGVNPRMLVGVPVAGAGGDPDVIPRSHQRSATRPVILQICGPIVVGDYSNGGNPVKGRVTITLNDDPVSKAVGYLYLPSYGRVRVKNLVNGETKLVTSDIDGNFSTGIASDIGDAIEVLSLDDNSGLVQSILRFNTKYKGTAAQRNTPDMRRFIALAQWAMERGDAINMAPHYFTNAHGAPWQNYPDKSVLQINTTGDANVPINTGNSIATASGLWTLDEAQWLIDKGINLGYVPPPYATTSQYILPIYDPEDLDDDGLKCGFAVSDPRCTTDPPFTMPLPPIPVAGGTRVSAVRWPYVEEKGHHAFALPGDDNHGIDWGIYMANQMGYFFASDGACIIDDPWELHSAPMITPGPDGSFQTAQTGDDQLHTIRILTTLGKNPCNYPFPEIDVITTGTNFKLDSVPAGDDVLIDYNSMYRGP